MQRISFMKLLLPTFFICLISTLLPAQKIQVITNVNVIPMTKETVLKNKTVIIENGKISRIGDAGKLKAPANAAIIDAKGQYLLPGFFDMHTHFFYEQAGNVNTCVKELKMMLANGVTTARILCGDPAYLDARQQVRSGNWAGPELFVASPQFVGRWPWPGKVFAAICTTPDEATTAVKKFKAEGYDEIKITFMVKRDVYDAIIKTAVAEGIKVCGHVGPLVKLPAALAARQQIEHMDEFIEQLLPDTSYNHGMSVSDMGIWKKPNWETVDHLDEQRIPALVQQVKKAGIYVTPTNYFFLSSFGKSMNEEEIKRKPDFDYIPAHIKPERYEIRKLYWDNAPSEERLKKYINLRRQMTQALWKGGVKLMTGSDSPEWFLVQGFAVHNEIETFVQAGLTPYAALETATRNPAAYLGVLNRKGTVEEGKEASLILLDKNPLDDIRNTRSIRGIFSGNQYYDRGQLDQMLQQAKASAN
jgi:hypothetical protein